MSRMSKTMIIALVAQAEGGVDYDRQRGMALCPACGKRAKVVTTRNWDGNVRLRYHKCMNKQCLLYRTGTTIKSIEVDALAA
ncbi:ogr/Delta-like zinc finger family protein [Desulfovibrio mangrovi]|uniref:ogr/Delta-like zinc finger family protein n=1 Tax=Desulfovibrio mangrovi TaxID=2976983 RepID=UPI002246F349|nr:ogr/Delta-like zinc finger family protein [Desulfovibrio mangrovi]UZP67728.1 ogr/Delta-like zinc finger family protein [Desulfovibrio mangrovi]